ncbi:MAG: PorP/SprF family type IX secretion system membrane protein [Chitinophagales bacterium]|nr:PorP/SprF family type IX secretion system membrane protein [Chitinophagales bacterium]MDW8273908.1 PorP/SprF family type IX secretion system membrane protein [Chitinophagales bacterium]
MLNCILRAKYFLSALLIVVLRSESQDFHYTQFFNSPLTLNPALTGFTRGSFRLGAAYRTQWFSVTSSSFFNSMYATPSFFVDAPIMIGKDAIGLGGLFVSDQTGSGLLNSFTGCFSAAFIKTLDKKNNHRLSAGVQVGFSNKQVRAANLKYSSQFIGATYIPSLSNGENFDELSINMLNMNTGLLWFGRISKRTIIYAGTSFFNVLQQRDGFIQTSLKRWFLRWNFHSAVDITVGRLVHLIPGLFYMSQVQTNQMMPSLITAYDITPVATIAVGAFVRTNNFFNQRISADAVSAYFSFDYKGFKFGASYDVTISDLQKKTIDYGALELTLIYLGRRRSNDGIVFCPIF